MASASSAPTVCPDNTSHFASPGPTRRVRDFPADAERLTAEEPTGLRHVLVNGTLVAHGEVVVVNDKFGIRLLDVVSPEKRVESLKE